MCRKLVCLLVCLSILPFLSGAFCVARSRTPTVAKSLGLRYVHRHLALCLNLLPRAA